MLILNSFSKNMWNFDRLIGKLLNFYLILLNYLDYTKNPEGFSFEKLSLSDIGTLTFEKPDTETFRLLPLCIEAITDGGLKPTAVNGANEQAVKLFLEGKIKFLQIQELVEKALLSTQNKSDFTVEDIFETDKLARECVMRNV